MPKKSGKLGVTMKYATIGTSWIAEKYVSAAKTVPGIELEAVYSRRQETAETFAEKSGAIKTYTDLTALACDASVDSVYIASPNRFHYEQSKMMLEACKNVICEKPATTAAAEMRELYELAEAKGLIYTEAIMSIHTPAFPMLKEALAKLGRIRTARLDFCQLSSKYPLFLEGKKPNIFNPAMHAGCLMDIGVYNLYLAAALFGKPETVVSCAEFLDNGADAAGAAILRYPGLCVSMCYSKVGQQYAPSEIVGDEGTIQIGSVSQLTGIKLLTKDGATELVPEDLSRDDVMRGEAAFFLRMAQAGDYSDAAYRFAKETALTVREICDFIRRENGFIF